MTKFLYRLARLGRDLKSLSGPEKFMKRQVRKRVYRKVLGWISRFI